MAACNLHGRDVSLCALYAAGRQEEGCFTGQLRLLGSAHSFWLHSLDSVCSMSGTCVILPSVYSTHWEGFEGTDFGHYRRSARLVFLLRREVGAIGHLK